MSDKLSDRDVRHVWHPCSQMQDYEDFAPVHVAKASGPYLFTADGKRIIDAVSSWWCKSLGHGNRRIKEAVVRQLDNFEHVIAANTCTQPLVELSERLAALCPGLDRVFYAGDGSSGMEIALKMSLQYHAQTGSPGRNQFMALRNGYHGETILTLAAGDCEQFSKPFVHLMPEIPKLGPLPYVSGPEDPGWDKLAPGVWEPLAAQLDAHAPELAALVFEPVVQGSGGMLVYSPRAAAPAPPLGRRQGRPAHRRRDHDWHGPHREVPGLRARRDHAGLRGVLQRARRRVGAVDGGRDLRPGLRGVLRRLLLGQGVPPLQHLLGLLVGGGGGAGGAESLRGRGGGRRRGGARPGPQGPAWPRWRAAAAVCGTSEGWASSPRRTSSTTGTGEPFPVRERMGYRCYPRRAVELGAWLRPIGDCLYFLPPLNTNDQVLDELAEITIKALRAEIGR